MGQHHTMFNGMFWGHSFMWLLWAVFLAFMVYFAMCFLMQGRSKHKKSSTDNALNLLQERFARGEIGKEEYQERKLILEM